MPGIGRRSCIGREGKLQSKEKWLCILMMKFLFLILFIIWEKRTFRAIVALPSGIVTAGYMEEINKDESL